MTSPRGIPKFQVAGKVIRSVQRPVSLRPTLQTSCRIFVTNVTIAGSESTGHFKLSLAAINTAFLKNNQLLMIHWRDKVGLRVS